MKTPNLFLVGFQKCGSSSLFDFLVQHPAIEGTSKKETFALSDESYEHYSWTNSVKNEDFSWDQYLNFSESKKYFLEGSVSNFYQKTAKEFIGSIENAKVIFLVRNPLDRFVSAFNYYGRNGIYFKPNTTIEDFYNISLNKSSEKEGVNFAIDHGRYAAFIQEWKELLGADSVLILGMKEIIKTPEICAEKLSRFLDIENTFPAGMSHKNKSMVVKHKELHLILRGIANAIGFKNKWLISKYKTASRKEADKLPLDVELKTKLSALYSEEFDNYASYF